MLKKTIKYVDYNGTQREEDFYFHLSKAELIKMDLTTSGGMEAALHKIIAEQDLPKLYTYFESIVQSSYGEKSPDGKFFDKNPENLRRFTQSPAYDQLIMELVGDANSAAAFCNGIIPSDLAQQVAAKPGQAPIAGVIAPTV